MDSIAGISYSIRVTQLPFRSMAVVGLEIYLIIHKYLLDSFHIKIFMFTKIFVFSFFK